MRISVGDGDYPTLLQIMDYRTEMPVCPIASFYKDGFGRQKIKRFSNSKRIQILLENELFSTETIRNDANELKNTINLLHKMLDLVYICKTR